MCMSSNPIVFTGARRAVGREEGGNSPGNEGWTATVCDVVMEQDAGGQGVRSDKAGESRVCVRAGGSVSVYVCAVSSPPLKHGTALERGSGEGTQSQLLSRFSAVETFRCLWYPAAVGCVLGGEDEARGVLRAHWGVLGGGPR